MQTHMPTRKAIGILCANQPLWRPLICRLENLVPCSWDEASIWLARFSAQATPLLTFNGFDKVLNVLCQPLVLFYVLLQYTRDVMVYIWAHPRV